MALDRGGLRYTIEVKNSFSGPLRDFKAGLDDARTAFRNFRRSISSLSTEADRLETSMARVRTASREAANQAQRFERHVSPERVNRLATAYQRLAVAQTRSATAQAAAAPQGQAQARAIRSVDAAATRNTAAQTRQARATNTAAAASTRAARAQRRLGDETQKAEGRVNRISFTFRRLFGILATFAAARAAYTGFVETVRQTVDFSSSLENTRLGLASLFTVLGNVRNAQGELLTGSAALDEGLSIAEDQMKKLRVEALQTAATFDELASTFQIGLGPGLQAGLDVNQVRQFTVQISQAASALGVAQNQLSEEIRSILSGTIQQRTTRIAAALGITNEDIRQAKEAGRVFEFLQQRFAGFSVAGRKALDTFSARVTNAKDAVLLLASSGAEGFFTSLKGLLADVANAAVQFDESTKNLTVNQGAVEAFKGFFDGLKEAVEDVRALRDNIPVEQVRNIAQGFGEIVTVLSGLVTGALPGIVAGVSDLVSLIRGAVAGVVSLANTLSLGLFQGSIVDAQELLGILIRIAVVSKGISLTWAGLAGIFGASVAPIVLAGLAITAAGVAIKGLAEELTGLQNLSFANTLKAIGIEFKFQFFRIGAEIEAIFARVGLAIDESLTRGVIKFIDRLNKGAFSSLLRSFGLDTAAGVIEAIGLAGGANALGEFASDAADQSRKIQEGLLSKITELDNQKKSELAEIKKTQADIDNTVEGGVRSITEGVKEVAEGSKEAANGLGTVTAKLRDSGEEANKLSASLRTALQGVRQLFGELDRSEKSTLNAARSLQLLQLKLKLLNSPDTLATETLKAQASFIKQDYATAVQKLTSRFEQLKKQRQDLIDQGLFFSGETRLIEGQLVAVQSLIKEEKTRLSLALQKNEVEQDILNQQRLAREEARRSSGPNNRGGVDAGFLQDLSGNVETVQNLQNQIFEALLLDEEESGEVISSYSDFFDRLGNLVGDFFSNFSFENLLAGFGSGVLTGLLGGLAAPGQTGDQVRGGGSALPGSGGATASIGQSLEQAIPPAEVVAQKTEETSKNTADAASSALALGGGMAGVVQQVSSAVPLFTQTSTTTEQINRTIMDIVRETAAWTAEVERLNRALKASGSAVAAAGGGAGGAGSFGFGPTTSSGVTSGNSGGTGFNEGGEVPGGPARAKPPAGVHPSDTVPAWLTPGEWVMRRESVSRYGASIMAALNSGLVDPAVLRGAIRQRKAPHSVRKTGFNTGGGIEPGASGGGATVAAVVANEQTMERLLSGGRNALRKFMSDEGYQRGGR